MNVRLLLLLERSEPHRVWDEAVPLLREAGVDARIGTVFAAGPLHQQLAGLGVSAFALGCRSSKDYARGAARLATMARSWRADVIQGTEPIPALIGGVGGLGARNATTIFHRQHCYFENNARLTACSRLASRLNDITLACSRAAADYATRLDRVPRERVRVAYNGANQLRRVDAGEVGTLRRSLNISDDAAVISVVSRLRREKGLTTLIAALPAVAAEVPRKVDVVVAGDGPERAELEELASRQPVPVHFVGSQDDVAPWYAVGDVVAMPSEREAFGVTAAEAMSCARPLVASAVGGLLEVVADDLTGLLVPPSSPPLLAAALARILRDPIVAQRMGAAARERFLKHFTNEGMIRGWTECYSAARSGINQGRPASSIG